MRSCPILRSSRADLRLGNVVIFRDLLNRLLVRHRIPGDAGFELGTQGAFFFVDSFGFISGVSPPKRPAQFINKLLAPFPGATSGFKQRRGRLFLYVAITATSVRGSDREVIQSFTEALL